jgi:hypothetical protein
MKTILRPLGSPAMIIACAALIVALGGVSYAAGVLPKGSVGTPQLQKKAVTASKLRANSVNGLKVKNGSLAAADFKAGQLPAGPKGDPGAQGPKGDQGEPGVAQVMVRTSDHLILPPNSVKSAVAHCQPGEIALGGGASTQTGVVMQSSYAELPFEAPSGWVAVLGNTNGYTVNGPVVEAVCARVG